jgi:hypothetical protein
MSRLAGVLVIAVALLTSCGGDEGDGLTEGTPPPSASPSVASNPCVPEGGPELPPDVAAVTEQFIGLSGQDAKALAREQDLTTRVAGRDGECFAMTLDYREDRVNLYLEDGLVVAATIG